MQDVIGLEKLIKVLTPTYFAEAQRKVQ